MATRKTNFPFSSVHFPRLFLFLIVFIPRYSPAQDSATIKKINDLNEKVWQLFNEARYDSALALVVVSISEAKEANYQQGQAEANGRAGIIYDEMGQYSTALRYHYQSLKLMEKIGSQKGIADCINNIGAVHEHLGNFKEAFSHQFKALEIRKKIQDKRGMSNSYNNIGLLYHYQSNFSMALEYLNKALEIKKTFNDSADLCASYNNIGLVYEQTGRFAEARKNYETCLALTSKENSEAMAMTYLSLGAVSNKLLEFKAARKYLDDAFSSALKSGKKVWIKECYYYFYELDTLLGNFGGALANYKKYIACGDSLLNEETTKKTVQTEMQYEFDKKEAAAKLEQEKKEAIAQAEKKKQRIILLAVSGFGLLIMGFALFAYRSFLQKKRANIEISKQKHLIEEKQKEILDSIYYARRIQRSLLPHEKYIAKTLLRLQNN